MFTDLPLDELRRYLPSVAEPADFTEFWAAQMADLAPQVEFRPALTPLRHADVLDVTFAGHGGDPVRGWLLVPHRQRPAAPVVVVEFVGYNGGRGDPADWLGWSSSGYVHLVMDSRGQGGGWRAADTPDPGDRGGPSTNGFLTRGIADPAGYYFTRLFVDAAHLAGGVAATMPDVPFLAHVRRAVEVTDAKPYGELIEYGALYPDRIEDVFRTLSYVDVVNHAKRVSAPALFAVGLLDEITPASTVFAAYNHYAGPAEITVHQFGDHDCAGTRQFHAKIEFLARLGLA